MVPIKLMQERSVLSAKVTVALLVVVLTMAGRLAEALPTLGPYDYPSIPYEFLYGVRDPHYGTDFGHEEQSHGGAVSGRYYVLLPDGRRQVVTYTADPIKGYVATVTYENVGYSPKGPGIGVTSYS